MDRNTKNFLWVLTAIVCAGLAYVLFTLPASAETQTAEQLCSIPKSPEMPGTGELSDVRYLNGVLVNCGPTPFICAMPDPRPANLSQAIRICEGRYS